MLDGPCSSFLGQGAPLQNSLEQFRLQQSFHFWNTHFKNPSLIEIEACINSSSQSAQIATAPSAQSIEVMILSRFLHNLIASYYYNCWPDKHISFCVHCWPAKQISFHVHRVSAVAGSQLDLFAGPMLAAGKCHCSDLVWSVYKYLFTKHLVDQVSLIC